MSSDASPPPVGNRKVARGAFTGQSSAPEGPQFSCFLMRVPRQEEGVKRGVIGWVALDDEELVSPLPEDGAGDFNSRSSRKLHCRILSSCTTVCAKQVCGLPDAAPGTSGSESTSRDGTSRPRATSDLCEHTSQLHLRLYNARGSSVPEVGMAPPRGRRRRPPAGLREGRVGAATLRGGALAREADERHYCALARFVGGAGGLRAQ